MAGKPGWHRSPAAGRRGSRLERLGQLGGARRRRLVLNQGITQGPFGEEKPSPGGHAPFSVREAVRVFRSFYWVAPGSLGAWGAPTRQERQPRGMRAEHQALVDRIKQAMDLLRRHL
ncbi:hypothetical protein ROR02_10330 [Pararhodospirillum oryzae]|uniref:Uncharacterized protein n=1 Tax=Pararhodospirillum oryzae TaxID=478448 RepID=A0A512H635_9PROT|nr:hypothetical protein ROR02_10330 [Pararhodospirillum oryzae]